MALLLAKQFLYPHLQIDLQKAGGRTTDGRLNKRAGPYRASKSGNMESFEKGFYELLYSPGDDKARLQNQRNALSAFVQVMEKGLAQAKPQQSDPSNRLVLPSEFINTDMEIWRAAFDTLATYVQLWAVQSEACMRMLRAACLTRMPARQLLQHPGTCTQR